MKTLMFIAALFATTLSFAQKPKVIETEDGKMHVYLDENKKQYIDFDLDLWNDIFPDNFIDIRVTGTWTIEICVRIATRRSGCTTGIGFRCKNCTHAIVIKSPEIKYAPVEATGVYQYLPREGKVRLTFDRYIDWDKLAKS
ncbi:MAG TPA: hypothetical protein PLS87_09180 [Ferruginibacter sp.]|nr:hypothetical protein [Ferruginibacter sp.]HRP49839.1 hypothetical protein [Ferruginibacter sp.]